MVFTKWDKKIIESKLELSQYGATGVEACLQAHLRGPGVAAGPQVCFGGPENIHAVPGMEGFEVAKKPLMSSSCVI